MQPDAGFTTYPTGSYPNVPRSTVSLRYLPEPDQIETVTDPSAVTLITNDGTALTTALALALQQRGHQVVVLSFGEGTARSGGHDAEPGDEFCSGPDRSVIFWRFGR